MSDPRCFYTILRAPHERLEDLLVEHVMPVVRDVRTAPELDSLFFVRYSEPTWQLRFRVLGEPAWIDGVIAPRLRALAEGLRAGGAIDGCEFATYDREYERYGGGEGMTLAERLFFRDSLAALDWMAAERAGAVARSRREFAVLLVDRLLDLARFDRKQRLAFYRHGYAWALDTGSWGERERETLEARYRELRPGLDALVFGPDGDAAWGGPAPAAIARDFLAAAAPVVDAIRAGHTEGRIRQDLVYLFWSYAHMFTNRLGIESAGEAVLRFFLHRLIEERGEVPAARA